MSDAQPTSSHRTAEILSGGIFHPFAETSAMVAALLGEHDIECRIHDDIEAGVAALGSPASSLLVVNALRWQMHGEKYDEYRDEWAFSLSDEGRRAIHTHVTNGGGLLALHTAIICFDDWPEWAQILGGGWVWGKSYHPPAGSALVWITDERHPITRGCMGFDLEEDEVYTNLDIRSDVTELLSGDAGEGELCVAWATTFGAGRVVCDALGHGERTLSDPNHRQILARAALWCLGASDDEIESVEATP